MKKFQKHFVGKGKQVEGLQIIKVTVNMKDLNDLSYEFNGEIYATFEVAKMKTADQFGREFTVYVSRKEEVEEQEAEKVEEPTSKPKKSRKKIHQEEELHL
jgi:hypothetical protein